MLTTRQVLLHRLTQERATIFHSFAFLPDEELVRRPAIGEWSVKDVVGHVAAWEAELMQAIGQFLRGEPISFLSIEDCDAWNAEQARLRWDRPFEQVQKEMIATRRRLLDLLAGLPDDAFAKPGPPPLEKIAFIPWVLNGVADHDREHWAGLMAYRERWVQRQQVQVTA